MKNLMSKRKDFFQWRTKACGLFLDLTVCVGCSVKFLNLENCSI